MAENFLSCLPGINRKHRKSLVDQILGDKKAGPDVIRRAPTIATIFTVVRCSAV